MLLIAVGVASFFLTPETATNRIVGELQNLVGPQGAQAVRQVIESSRGFGKGIWAVSVGNHHGHHWRDSCFWTAAIRIESHLGRQIETKPRCDRVAARGSVALVFDRDLRGFSPSGFPGNQRGYQRPPGLHEQLDARHALVLANSKRGYLIRSDRDSFCHDLQIFARRGDLMEGCLDRSRGNGAPFYRRKIPHRNLSGPHGDGECLRSGRLPGCPPILGLLLFADRFSWGGIYAGLRPTLWLKDPPAKTRGARRPKERFDLM